MVDLRERAVRVVRDPSASGYRPSFTATAGDAVSAAGLPGVSVAVAALFPE